MLLFCSVLGTCAHFIFKKSFPVSQWELVLVHLGLWWLMPSSESPSYKVLSVLASIVGLRKFLWELYMSPASWAQCLLPALCGPLGMCSLPLVSLSLSHLCRFYLHTVVSCHTFSIPHTFSGTLEGRWGFYFVSFSENSHLLNSKLKDSLVQPHQTSPCQMKLQTIAMGPPSSQSCGLKDTEIWFDDNLGT